MWVCFCICSLCHVFVISVEMATWFSKPTNVLVTLSPLRYNGYVWNRMCIYIFVFISLYFNQDINSHNLGEHSSKIYNHVSINIAQIVAEKHRLSRKNLEKKFRIEFAYLFLLRSVLTDLFQSIFSCEGAIIK